MGAPTSQNKVNDRLVDENGSGSKNPTDTTKINYTETRYGNDHGSVAFGHIHKPGDVTSAACIQAKTGKHGVFLDNDGQRKGWTSSISPGNFQVSCGEANEEAQDTMFLHASNGNIIVLATNGKLRLQATDIELVAVGEGGSKGNIKMVATENISLDCKKFIANAKSLYKIVSPGSAELVANAQMKIYSSVIRGATDGCALKNSKNNLQKIQKENQ
tara:strand:- start:276 stop:923 length:648 start_codon:yes stop_codon:yes gene_type:complete